LRTGPIPTPRIFGLSKLEPVREGILHGNLPYLALGVGEPLVYLCGSTANHRVPKPGLERFMTMRTMRPLAERGFEVHLVNRWPNMDPASTSADIAERHADAILEHFGGPAHVLGHSTGGSLALQLIADRPDAVRKAVVASAAYRLGPIAKRSQLTLARGLQQTGHYTAEALIEGTEGMVSRPWVRAMLSPLLSFIAPRITVENVSDAVTMLMAEDAFDVRDRLETIQTENLVIWGAKDHFWTPEMFTETAARIPRATSITYPNSGHAIMTERRFAEDVSVFLHGA